MDDFEDNLPNHLFISLNHEFKATRVVDNFVSPTTIKIKVDISTKPDDTDEYTRSMDIGLNKIEHFVQNVLDGCLIINESNDWAVESFLSNSGTLTANPVLLSPEEPSDACLCELLICKFKAITNNAFNFQAIEVKSADSKGMSFTFIGSNPGEDFPTGEEWLSKHNYFNKPWWHRDDASTMDIFPEEDEPLDNPPQWAYSMGFIADAIGTPEHMNNVVRTDFKLKLIQGGKVEE